MAEIFSFLVTVLSHVVAWSLFTVPEHACFLKQRRGDRQTVRVRALVQCQFSNRDVKILAISVDMKKYIITECLLKLANLFIFFTG